MKNDKYSITRSDIYESGVEEHIHHIQTEFRDGFEFLKKYPKSVTIFGSSRAKPENEYYRKAEELAGRVVRELQYAVITGGGPGIMEAANKGAYQARGDSVGLNVSIPHERNVNAYCAHSIKFSYFFVRKTMLTFAAEAYVFFPGGFGSLDEFFSILTLIQTEKIPRVPLILFGSDYWNGLKQFMENKMRESYHTIDSSDIRIPEITDSIDHVMEIIRKAPMSEWWRNIN
jgi:hypothetical protein